jgi:hypothetical protein
MYGIVTETDGQLIEQSLDLCIKKFKNNLLLVEIGVNKGNTSRGIKNYLLQRNINFTYYGIDSGRDGIQEHPFQECIMLNGLSEEVYYKCPDNIHWLFIDGCHCSGHVILDFCHYGNKVALGGLVIFHDTNPKNQYKFDYQGHGPKDYHEFGTAAVTALRKLGLSNSYRLDWKLVMHGWDDQEWGGIMVFERTKI